MILGSKACLSKGLSSEGTWFAMGYCFNPRDSTACHPNGSVGSQSQLMVTANAQMSDQKLIFWFAFVYSGP